MKISDVVFSFEYFWSKLLIIVSPSFLYIIIIIIVN
jgi:hypothetical protein